MSITSGERASKWRNMFNHIRSESVSSAGSRNYSGESPGPTSSRNDSSEFSLSSPQRLTAQPIIEGDESAQSSGSSSGRSPDGSTIGDMSPSPAVYGGNASERVKSRASGGTGTSQTPKPRTTFDGAATPFGAPVPSPIASPSRSRFFKPSEDGENAMDWKAQRLSRAPTTTTELATEFISSPFPISPRPYDENPSISRQSGRIVKPSVGLDEGEESQHAASGGVSVPNRRFFKEIRPSGATNASRTNPFDIPKRQKSPQKDSRARNAWSLDPHARRTVTLQSTHGKYVEYNGREGTEQSREDFVNANLSSQVRELAQEVRDLRNGVQSPKSPRTPLAPGSNPFLSPPHAKRPCFDRASNKRNARSLSPRVSRPQLPQFLPPDKLPGFGPTGSPLAFSSRLGGSFGSESHQKWRGGLGGQVSVAAPDRWNGWLKHSHSVRPAQVVDDATGNIVGYDASFVQREAPSRHFRTARQRVAGKIPQRATLRSADPPYIRMRKDQGLYDIRLGAGMLQRLEKEALARGGALARKIGLHRRRQLEKVLAEERARYEEPGEAESQEDMTAEMTDVGDADTAFTEPVDQPDFVEVSVADEGASQSLSFNQSFGTESQPRFYYNPEDGTLVPASSANDYDFSDLGSQPLFPQTDGSLSYVTPQGPPYTASNTIQPLPPPPPAPTWQAHTFSSQPLGPFPQPQLPYIEQQPFVNDYMGDFSPTRQPVPPNAYFQPGPFHPAVQPDQFTYNNYDGTGNVFATSAHSIQFPHAGRPSFPVQRPVETMDDGQPVLRVKHYGDRPGENDPSGDVDVYEREYASPMLQEPLIPSSGSVEGDDGWDEVIRNKDSLSQFQQAAAFEAAAEVLGEKSAKPPRHGHRHHHKSHRHSGDDREDKPKHRHSHRHGSKRRHHHEKKHTSHSPRRSRPVTTDDSSGDSIGTSTVLTLIDKLLGSSSSSSSEGRVDSHSRSSSVSKSGSSRLDDVFSSVSKEFENSEREQAIKRIIAMLGGGKSDESETGSSNRSDKERSRGRRDGRNGKTNRRTESARPEERVSPRRDLSLLSEDTPVQKRKPKAVKPRARSMSPRRNDSDGRSNSQPSLPSTVVAKPKGVHPSMLQTSTSPASEGTIVKRMGAPQSSAFSPRTGPLSPRSHGLSDRKFSSGESASVVSERQTLTDVAHSPTPGNTGRVSASTNASKQTSLIESLLRAAASPFTRSPSQASPSDREKAHDRSQLIASRLKPQLGTSNFIPSDSRGPSEESQADRSGAVSKAKRGAPPPVQEVSAGILARHNMGDASNYESKDDEFGHGKSTSTHKLKQHLSSAGSKPRHSSKKMAHHKSSSRTSKSGKSAVDAVLEREMDKDMRMRKAKEAAIQLERERKRASRASNPKS